MFSSVNDSSLMTVKLAELRRTLRPAGIYWHQALFCEGYKFWLTVIRYFENDDQEVSLNVSCDECGVLSLKYYHQPETNEVFSGHCDCPVKTILGVPIEELTFSYDAQGQWWHQELYIVSGLLSAEYTVRPRDDDDFRALLEPLNGGYESILFKSLLDEAVLTVLEDPAAEWRTPREHLRDRCMKEWYLDTERNKYDDVKAPNEIQRLLSKF